jgi:hypothetical protein
MRTAGVVAGGEKNTPDAVPVDQVEVANVGGTGRSTHKPALGDMQLIDPIGTGNSGHNVNDLRSQEAAISADQQAVLG